MAKRIDQLLAARKHLTDAQLIAFIREAAKEDHPRALVILCKHLESGKSLTEMAAMYNGEGASSLAWVLKVKVKGPNTYVVTCGFHGALVGDGGSFKVVFDTKGTLVSVEQEGFWTC